MIGKWFLPLPFIFANKNYTLTIGDLSYEYQKGCKTQNRMRILYGAIF